MKNSLLACLVVFVIGLALFLFGGATVVLPIIGSLMMIGAGIAVLLGAMRSRKT